MNFVVPLSDLVEKARQEVNRAIGSSTSGADQFKAKSFPDHPAIIDLFNKSLIPSLLGILFGDKLDKAKYEIDRGQLAIRFPGDLCISDTCESSPEHFMRIRQGWHIDGCPNDYVPGLTDHYGTIHNFDVLCGVLLSSSG